MQTQPSTVAMVWSSGDCSLILGGEWHFATAAQLIHRLKPLHWKNYRSSAHHENDVYGKK